MQQDDELVARGAECVAGDLIFRQKVMGRYRNGGFQITQEGLDELAITDVEVKAVPTPTPDADAQPRAAKARTVKAQAVKTPTAVKVESAPVEPPQADSTDALLAGLDAALGS